MSQPTLVPTQEKLFERLADLPDEAERRELLSRNPSLRSPGAVTALTDLVRDKIRVDVLRALRMADLALTISQDINDTESLARCASSEGKRSIRPGRTRLRG